MARLALNRITDGMWQGYAGAESFADGGKPWFYQTRISTEILVDIIVDPNGVSVCVYDESDEDDQMYDLNGEHHSDDTYGVLSRFESDVLDTDGGKIRALAEFLKTIDKR